MALDGLKAPGAGWRAMWFAGRKPRMQPRTVPPPVAPAKLTSRANCEGKAASHLLGMAFPIHIAEMAVYLASDESAITTGQIMSVDSGVTIY